MLAALTSAVLALAGCGDGAGASWREPDDYAYTLELFDGECGAASRGAWRITVENGAAVEAEPLNDEARESAWAEGAPTIGEQHAAALGVRQDGAYDAVDIDEVDEGPEAGRLLRVHYVDRDGGAEGEGHESCEEYRDVQRTD
ncbi:hypothetical protein D7319_13400 [Streptomyces radicis]|uniref:Lipoprotein n=1 Tax=Streptomyces radicis TaxID=1750517 RepID=A0A3A9W6X3_9ACTN|nr:hypothetical protein D7319_13400 [Streptomyces radicis]RKN22873.1 hypothetical protein D7318_15155 [Streptomyces radicis]